MEELIENIIELRNKKIREAMGETAVGNQIASPKTPIAAD